MRFRPERIDRGKFNTNNVYVETGIGGMGHVSHAMDALFIGYKGEGRIRISGYRIPEFHRRCADMDGNKYEIMLCVALDMFMIKDIKEDTLCEYIKI